MSSGSAKRPSGTLRRNSAAASGVLGQRRCHPRADHAGRDRVDPDAVAGEVERRGAHERDERALARGVVDASTPRRRRRSSTRRRRSRRRGPLATIARAPSCTVRKTPVRLTSSIRCHDASSISSSGVSAPIPATATTTSTPPKRRGAATSPRGARGRRRRRARVPARRAPSSPGSSASSTITARPRRAAVARPPPRSRAHRP